MPGSVCTVEKQCINQLYISDFEAIDQWGLADP